MALQDVLAGFANPAASRTAILAKLGIDPNRASGYGGNTQFDERMADLYRQGLSTAASLDTQEGDLNRGYEQNLAEAAINRDKALKAIQGSAAQRGMGYSGAYVDEVAENQGNFDRYAANLGADRTSGLNSIGRGRLDLEQGLTAGKQAAEAGYGADLSAFLQQQAVDLWNSVMAQNQQQAMLAAASRPQTVVQAPRPAAPARPAAPKPAPKPVTPVSSGGLRGQGYGRGPF